MKRETVRAYLLVVLVGICLGGFYFYLVESQQKSEKSNPLYSLEDMETKGVPRFVAQTIDGRDFKLESLMGKVVLINFWASWCAPCIDEFPSMIKLAGEFPDKFILVALSRDKSQEDIDVFLRSFPQIKRDNILLVWDRDGSIAKEYKVDRLPESYLVGRDLKLVRKIIGTLQWHTPEAIDFIRGL